MSKKLIALCACPMGLAHTFMAAQALEEAAVEAGYEVKIETQGADGGAVHLTGTGVPTVVMGPATRHGHCAASIADCRDILQMQQLLSALIQRLTRETVVQLTDFR